MDEIVMSPIALRGCDIKQMEVRMKKILFHLMKELTLPLLLLSIDTLLLIF
jgi:hypothetical protein